MIAYKVVRGDLASWYYPPHVYTPGTTLESAGWLYFYPTIREAREGTWQRRVGPSRAIIEAELDNPETLWHPQMRETYIVAHKCTVLRIVPPG